MLKAILVATVIATVGSSCGGGAAAPATTTTVPVPDATALAERGPHGVGKASYETDNPVQDGRPLRIAVYYPAQSVASTYEVDASPDTTGAPYPVVMGVEQMGLVMGPHLASHGFVFLAVGTNAVSEEVDTPREFSAALDAFETLSESPLTGLGNTDATGVLGYSGESLFALMLAGARIDPDHWAATCADQPAAWGDSFSNMVCSESRPLVIERADAAGISTSSGLWKSLRDDRVKAAMPMGPRGFYMTGPAGLAEAAAPILLIVGSEDTERLLETADILANYPQGLAEAITFVGADHSLIFDDDAVAQIRRFALAFLSYHLKGVEGFAQYLTEDFVNNVAPSLGVVETFDTLAWGAVGQ